MHPCIEISKYVYIKIDSSYKHDKCFKPQPSGSVWLWLISQLLPEMDWGADGGFSGLAKIKYCIEAAKSHYYNNFPSITIICCSHYWYLTNDGYISIKNQMAL